MKIGEDTKVCVTGAASGIGRATALAFAGRQSKLILTDINEAGLKETCRMVEAIQGVVLKSEAFDISDLESVRKFADSVHNDHGPLDILINNAGVALFSLVENMGHEHWKRIIDVDLWGPIHGIECFLPEMIRARKGHVVNVSSTAGLVGLPWHAAYSSAKFGLVGLSEVLRYDLRQHNIGVTVICPGAVKTPIRHSVTIIGADINSPPVQRAMARFERHAITPEHVAKQIVTAVERKRFLVITSLDIKALYFLRRCFHPGYHFILCQLSNLMNSLAIPKSENL